VICSVVIVNKRSRHSNHYSLMSPVLQPHQFKFNLHKRTELDPAKYWYLSLRLCYLRYLGSRLFDLVVRMFLRSTEEGIRFRTSIRPGETREIDRQFPSQRKRPEKPTFQLKKTAASGGHVLSLQSLALVCVSTE
jgi:hypothetical protein